MLRAQLLPLGKVQGGKALPVVPRLAAMTEFRSPPSLLGKTASIPFETQGSALRARQGTHKRHKAPARLLEPGPRSQGVCARGDLNPHARRHTDLNRARLPIPPLARVHAAPEYSELVKFTPCRADAPPKSARVPQPRCSSARRSRVYREHPPELCGGMPPEIWHLGTLRGHMPVEGA